MNKKQTFCPGELLYTQFDTDVYVLWKASALSDQIEQMKTTAVHMVTNMIVSTMSNLRNVRSLSMFLSELMI